MCLSSGRHFRFLSESRAVTFDGQTSGRDPYLHKDTAPSCAPPTSLIDHSASASDFALCRRGSSKSDQSCGAHLGREALPTVSVVV